MCEVNSKERILERERKGGKVRSPRKERFYGLLARRGRQCMLEMGQNKGVNPQYRVKCSNRRNRKVYESYDNSTNLTIDFLNFMVGPGESCEIRVNQTKSK